MFLGKALNCQLVPLFTQVLINGTGEFNAGVVGGGEEDNLALD